jgi:hypothetical protein
VWIEKAGGKKRPRGKPCFEDKIVQRAVVMILEAIFEQDFHAFSHGFRKGHSPHQALHELREQCRTLPINWRVDAEVSGFFDNLAWSHLRECIQQRVRDGGILRLIGKWLPAGVLEAGALRHPDKGTPQGGVVTPPTILQTFFFGVRIARVRIDPKHDIDVIPGHFHPLHEGTDEVPLTRPSGVRSSAVDRGSTIFETPNNQLQFSLSGGLICERLALFL